MKHILLFFLLSVLLSCSKSDNVPANRLAGTWRLSIYCKPVSASVCTLVEIPPTKGVYISFDLNGQFNESYENTKPAEYSFLGCGGGGYTVEGGDVRIMAVCMSSSGGRLVKLVALDDKRLVLNPFGTGEYTFVRK